MSIPFVDLTREHEQLRAEITAAIIRVANSGYYILGPEVEAFEQEFAIYHGVSYAVGTANGTDALELALRAADIGVGDEVITVSHTALPTVCGIERTGAKPILVDIDAQTYTIDVAAAEAAITPQTRAIIPVHLYGQPANLTALKEVANRHNIILIEDCAQAHGAKWENQLVGSFGDMAAFSFYPTKNLGAYGDAGAVLTNNSHFAHRLKRLRNYGQVSRYVYQERGINSRLDEVQAAILRVKLKYLDERNAERRDKAEQYNSALEVVKTPYTSSNCYHVYHLYVVRFPLRDSLIHHLANKQITTLIHYPKPIHLQQSHQDLGLSAGSLPITEQIASEIISLPIFIGLSSDAIKTIADEVNMAGKEALSKQ